MIIRNIVFSTTPPAMHNVLWIKAGDNNINTLYIFDGGWRKIGTSSGSGEGGTTDYSDLDNKPTINGVVLEGDLSLKDLGIILPDLSKYITKESLQETLSQYAKLKDIPSVEGLLSKVEAEKTFQKKGDYALKQDIPNTSSFATKTELNSYAKKTELPDTSSFITAAEVDTKLENYATVSDIPDVSRLATKQEVQAAVSDIPLKTINGQSIKGSGNIEISGGSTVQVDTTLNPDSNNPIANSAIAELLMKLDEKVFPITFSVSGGGTYEEGTTQIVTVTWKLQKDGATLTPDSVTVNEEVIDPSVNYKVFTDVTSSTSYKVVATYKGKQYTGTATVTFKKTYYRYYGGLPSGTEVGKITVDIVKKLKKEACTSAAVTLSYTCDDQRMSYAYPKKFGLLKDVIDPFFNSSYDNFPMEIELTIDGEPYYVYACDTASNVVDFKVKFQQ